MRRRELRDRRSCGASDAVHEHASRSGETISPPPRAATRLVPYMPLVPYKRPTTLEMILTQCPVCATEPTGHFSQTMQPLQDALLRAGLPEKALGGRWP